MRTMIIFLATFFAFNVLCSAQSEKSDIYHEDGTPVLGVPVMDGDTLWNYPPPATWNFNWSIRTESPPYAPITGMTVGLEAVAIGIATVKYNPTRTSLSYWKSIDVFQQDILLGGNGGNYDGFFLIQPIGKIFALKAIHFADWRSQDQSTTLLAIQAKGGGELKWSLHAINQMFLTRETRQSLWGSLTYGQLTLNNWVYYQFGELSWATGLEWKSPKWSLSDRWDCRANLVVNDTPSRRLGWSGKNSFGPNEVISFGLHFFPKKKGK